jgi:hypothetical protein
VESHHCRFNSVLMRAVLLAARTGHPSFVVMLASTRGRATRLCENTHSGSSPRRRAGGPSTVVLGHWCERASSLGMTVGWVAS